MGVQQSINQALGLGAILASQTDAFKNAQETRTAKKAVAGIESAMKREDLKPEAERSTKRYELLHEQLTALGHKYPHVDMPNMPGISDELQKRYKQANDKAMGIQMMKSTQRRNFMSYLAQQPISLGGKVGDLPKDMQKQIASQYSKTDRKKLMDQMDREKNINVKK